jgi:hypothetical protein
VQVAAAFEQLEEPDWLLVDAAQPQQAVAEQVRQTHT